MRWTRGWLALAALTLTCCASTGTPAPGGSPAPSPATRVSDEARPSFTGVPLVLDRADLALGTTVQLSRLPKASDYDQIDYSYGVSRLVLSLPDWPASYGDIESLNNRPVDLETIVILPGWPPTRGATEAWNMIHGPLRIVVVASGPPATRATLDDLNAMRGLERVIVQTDRPSRFGLERLQRPLSFRRILP